MLSLLTAALLLVLLSGAALAANDTWDEVQQTGVIRLGIIPDQRCYYWRNGKRDEWKGFPTRFAQDAMQHLEAKMGRSLRLEFVPTSWSTVVLDLQAAKLDLFMGMGITEERRRAINLFGPVDAVPNVIIPRKGFVTSGKMSDLNTPTTRISVVMGTTEEQETQERAPKATLRSMRSTAQVTLDVQSGNADVAIMTLINGLTAVSSNSNLQDPLIAQPYSAVPSGGGTRKDGDDRFYHFLQGWSEDFRSSGRVKEAILGALNECGLDVSRLPKDTKF